MPCWIAPRNIPPGAEYTEGDPRRARRRAGGGPDLLRAANASPHVRRELETAVGTDTALLPVRIEDVDPSPSLRYFIGTSQWLDTVGVRRGPGRPRSSPA